MVVVPADAVVLVPCLAEHLQDLADPASLADPVALNDHQVAHLRPRRILCWSHRNAPFSISPTTSLLPLGAPNINAACLIESWPDARGAVLPPEAPIALRGMPTYGYRCPKGHEFEAIHGMGAPPPTACQVCGAAPVSRVFYPISTSFTGTGFYSTDYGPGEQKPEPKTPADESVKVLDKGAKKPDEKTTNKPEPEQT
jgi:putative FmdB family regulatory protein